MNFAINLSKTDIRTTSCGNNIGIQPDQSLLITLTPDAAKELVKDLTQWLKTKEEPDKTGVIDMANSHKCTRSGCGITFKIQHPDPVGHEGATVGVYQSKCKGVLYNPLTHELYPFCPDCRFVDIDNPRDPEE